VSAPLLDICPVQDRYPVRTPPGDPQVVLITTTESPRSGAAESRRSRISFSANVEPRRRLVREQKSGPGQGDPIITRCLIPPESRLIFGETGLHRQARPRRAARSSAAAFRRGDRP